MLARLRPSPAMIVACIALAVALGGSAYAALKLPKNSVGSKQIKKNAVNSAKVKNGSLKVADFGAGQIPQGQKGDTGAPGSAAAYASVGFHGTIDAAHSKGIAQANISHTVGSGVYCFHDIAIRPKMAQATLTADSSNPGDTILSGGPAAAVGICPAGSDGEVMTFDSTNAAADKSVTIAFN